MAGRLWSWAKDLSRTLLEALLQKLRGCKVCSDAELAPVAILWTDPKREWLPLIPQLRSALPELISLGIDAETFLLIATYNIGLSRDCRDLFEHLAQRLAHGSLQEVQLFFHPKQIEPELGTEPLPRISEWFSRKPWPWDAKPMAYVDRRLVERSQDGCYQHAKAVIMDAGRPKAKAQLNSANFSETAQRHNYEAGCLMTAPWQVDRISQHFQSLVAQRHFILLLL